MVVVTTILLTGVHKTDCFGERQDLSCTYLIYHKSVIIIVYNVSVAIDHYSIYAFQLMMS